MSNAAPILILDGTSYYLIVIFRVTNSSIRIIYDINSNALRRVELRCSAKSLNISYRSIVRSFIQDTNVDYWKSILLSHFLSKGWFIFDKNDLILHKSFYFQTDPTCLVFLAEVYTVHLHHTNICIK